MFTDTHCHLYKEYFDDIDKVIDDAQKCSVNRFFVAGCNFQSNQEVISLINQYPTVYGCLGIHPEDVDNYTDDDIVYIQSHLNDKRIIAIGEIGLDYHYTKENRQKQIELFERQLNLALEYSLPVVIHSRDATQETIDILKKYPQVKGVIHSFSGSLEVAKIYVSMGYKLGINGVVTFKNSHLKEILPEILKDIVLETDSPYLTPHPYRGMKNESKYIMNIAEFIADYCGISVEELSEITNKNIFAIFDKLSSL